MSHIRVFECRLAGLFITLLSFFDDDDEMDWLRETGIITSKIEFYPHIIVRLGFTRGEMNKVVLGDIWCG